jgi:UDP-3-O-[3-hydroxymyristoyl] glucosamine N-acyltransferase
MHLVLRESGFISNAKEIEEVEPKIAYVYIGDSRTVGLNKAVNLSDMDDTFVVAKSGVGYNWFMKTGSEELYEIREDNIRLVTG